MARAATASPHAKSKLAGVLRAGVAVEAQAMVESATTAAQSCAAALLLEDVRAFCEEPDGFRKAGRRTWRRRSIHWTSKRSMRDLEQLEQRLRSD